MSIEWCIHNNILFCCCCSCSFVSPHCESTICRNLRCTSFNMLTEHMDTVSGTITIPVPVPYCLRLRHRSFNVTERSSRKSHQRTEHSSGCCQLTSLVMQETEEDSETKNQTMEYQPRDTQISITGDIYVVLRTYTRRVVFKSPRTLWPVLHHENRKKTKQVCNDITLIALLVLPAEPARWNVSNSARDPVWDHLKSKQVKN